MKGYGSLIGVLASFLILYGYISYFAPVNRDLLNRAVHLDTHVNTGALAAYPSPGTITENQEVVRLAKEYLQHTNSGQTFDVSMHRLTARWALTDASNFYGTKDSQVLLQKIRGRWTVVATGEEVSKWKQLAPELFAEDDRSATP